MRLKAVGIFSPDALAVTYSDNQTSNIFKDQSMIIILLLK